MSFPGIVNVKFIFLGLILLVFGTDDKIRAQVSGEPRPGQEVVLVTGSTGGLGREVAKRLGLQGAHVIVHGRNLERGIELVDEINEESSGSARFY